MHTVVRILRSKYYITRKPSEGQCIRWQADTISLNKEKTRETLQEKTVSENVSFCSTCM